MGGVWAPTSAKRDKISELKIELPEEKETLDEAATELELLDLYLADGLKEIVKAAEEETQHAEMTEFLEWLESSDAPQELAQVQWETYLTSIVSEVDAKFNGIPKDRYLKEVRDFMPTPTEETDVSAFMTAQSEEEDTLAAFQMCILRYRLHMIKAAAEHLKENWEKLVTVTDGDINRAAVTGETIPPKASTLSRDAVKRVMIEFATGTCITRFDALWDLVDRDDDGLLDGPEVGHVAYFCVEPVGKALQALTDEALEARPVRQPLDDDDEEEGKQEGFLARRRQKNVEKRLRKNMARAATSHFEDEVEMPHRLRCIYAWAEKAHQDNKIDAIHIDTGLGGRKRYVEVEPKIKLPEFREVQKEHFPHLNRIAEEMVGSFREDLWVDQGKGRQRIELQRNTFYFMLTICAIDAGIYFL